MAAKAKFKQGQRLKVVGTASGHQATLGETVVVKSININGPLVQYLAKVSSGADNWLYEQDLAPIAYTRVEMQTHVEELEKQLAEARSKLRFAEDNNLDEVDDVLLRAFSALNTIEDKSLSRIEKAKTLAALFTQT